MVRLESLWNAGQGALFLRVLVPVSIASMVASTAVAQNADLPEIKAPSSEASITAEQLQKNGFRAVVTGWSCGPDVVSEYGAKLAEMLRQKQTLQRQITGAEALKVMPGFAAQKDSKARENQLNKLMKDIKVQGGRPLDDIDSREIAELSRIKSFRDIKAFVRGFRHFDGERVSFGNAGIGDDGTTRIGKLASCIPTRSLTQFARRLQVAAKEVIDLKIKLKTTRDNTLRRDA